MPKQILHYFTVPGAPRVKKNNQRVFAYRGRPRVVYTTAYQNWASVAHYEIMKQPRPLQPIERPVILQCTFYMPTRHRVDLSGLYEGIQDVLVKTGVLRDDNCRIVIGHDGSRVLTDRENPRMEVAILAAPEAV